MRLAGALLTGRRFPAQALELGEELLGLAWIEVLGRVLAEHALELLAIHVLCESELLAGNVDLAEQAFS
ncbi:hypothetical protein D9M68_437500 [compost metagenome]